MAAKPGRASKIVSMVLLVLGAVSLFLAQSSYWVNHTVFDRQNFSRITTNALLSESSRDAIATSIVNSSLDDRPIIKRVAGERATSLISGLLGSDLSAQAVSELTSRTYAYTTSSNRQDIKIDLTAIKTPVETIISLAQNRGTSVPLSSDQIPDEIVLLRSDAFPNLSGIVKLMLWVGPLLWLASVVLFGLYIYLGRAVYARRVYIAGGAVIAVSMIGLLTGPFLPPPIAAAIPNIDLRPVAQNLTSAFLAPFITQMYWMLGVTLAVLTLFNQRFNILAVFRSVGARVNNRPPAARSRS